MLTLCLLSHKLSVSMLAYAGADANVGCLNECGFQGRKTMRWMVI